MTSVQDLFGIALPIIQAPMAGVQDSTLAIAVSNAGGLGSLPCALLTPETMRAQLECITAQSDKPYNVNFFCHTPPTTDEAREMRWRALLAPYYAEYGIGEADIPKSGGRAPFSGEFADVLESFAPPVVSFHFGLPEQRLLDRVKTWGAKVIASATTVDEGHWLQARGVDAVIAQGLEAGGHRGNFLSHDLTLQSDTFTLLQNLCRQLTVPVIAAGGIAHAADVARALQCGAAGVQVGTAYLLCPEAQTSPVHREALRLVNSPTAITNLFTGRPARGIINRLMRELGPINAAAPDFPLATNAVTPLRARAEAQNRGDFSPLWAGQNTSGCGENSAADLTRSLAPAS